MEILKQIAISAIPHLITTLPILILTFTNIGKIPDIIAKLDISIENDLTILWNELNNECKKVISNNSCDVGTMTNIEQLYEQYKKIGGNHGMNILVKKAKQICEQSSRIEKSEILK